MPGSRTTAAARLDALEQRVAALEGSVRAGTPAADLGERFWVLDGLRQQLAELTDEDDGPAGGVVFAGSVRVADGPVEWQQGAMAADLFDADWGELSTGLAALGHPVRCRLLHAVLTGTRSASALAELPGLGTSGQVYHHLRALTAAGWLRGGTRGTWRVPPERVVPLLVLLSAVRP